MQAVGLLQDLGQPGLGPGLRGGQRPGLGGQLGRVPRRAARLVLPFLARALRLAVVVRLGVGRRVPSTQTAQHQLEEIVRSLWQFYATLPNRGMGVS